MTNQIITTIEQNNVADNIKETTATYNGVSNIFLKSLAIGKFFLQSS